jgi:hypothetical protein
MRMATVAARAARAYASNQRRSEPRLRTMRRARPTLQRLRRPSTMRRDRAAFELAPHRAFTLAVQLGDSIGDHGCRPGERYGSVLSISSRYRKRADCTAARLYRLRRARRFDPRGMQHLFEAIVRIRRISSICRPSDCESIRIEGRQLRRYGAPGFDSRNTGLQCAQCSIQLWSCHSHNLYMLPQR